MVRCPQCDILLCEKDDCQEPLCVTDPDSETGRSLPAPASAAEEDEDKTRMMASTTVFVVEPGVTALGRLILQLQMPYQCDVRQKHVSFDTWNHLLFTRTRFLPIQFLTATERPPRSLQK